MKWSSVLDIKNGRNQRAVESTDGKYPIYGSGGIMGYATDYLCPENTVIIGRKGSINKPLFVDTKLWNVDTAFGLVAHKGILDPKYLYYFCRSFNFESLNTTVTIPSLTKANLLEIDMPVPSFNDQKKIVLKLDAASEVLRLRKAQLAELDNLVKSQFIEMFGDPIDNPKKWDVVQLDALFDVGSSKRIYQREQTASGIPFLRISDLVQRITTGMKSCELYISEDQFADFYARQLVPEPGDILVTSRGTLGLCYVVKDNDRFYFQDGMISWLHKKSPDINETYVAYLFQLPGFRKQIDDVPTGSTVNYLSLARLAKLNVMYPPVEMQKWFLTIVEATDESKFAIHQALDETQRLFDSLMAEYFEA